MGVSWTARRSNQSIVKEIIPEAESPTLLPPDAESQFIGKYPDAGEGWGQEEKARTEDEIVGFHHRLNGHEFEQTLGDNEG